MKKFLGYAYAVIMFIITLPIGLIIYKIAETETFTGDPPPKYYVRFLHFITWPLEKLDKQ